MTKKVPTSQFLSSFLKLSKDIRYFFRSNAIREFLKPLLQQTLMFYKNFVQVFLQQNFFFSLRSFTRGKRNSSSDSSSSSSSSSSVGETVLRNMELFDLGWNSMLIEERHFVPVYLPVAVNLSIPGQPGDQVTRFLQMETILEPKKQQFYVSFF